MAFMISESFFKGQYNVHFDYTYIQIHIYIQMHQTKGVQHCTQGCMFGVRTAKGEKMELYTPYRKHW